MTGRDQDSDLVESQDTALAATEGSADARGDAGDEDALLGRSLAGRYRIEARIGRGGMGLVYRARHEALDKRVAVKLMRRELAADEASMARFEREARAAAALSGEHVVDVSDYGRTEDGEAFMVMELLEGVSLEGLLLREGPLEAGRATAIARQIARGLATAHEGGVIHRDLKTANVFLVDRDGRDHVKLVDFGISKLSRPDPEQVKLTSTGAVMGTPSYMSPEQARGETDLDHRVDIYALGVILFETLTGGIPFPGGNFLEVAYKIVNTTAPSPSEVRPDRTVPPELDAVVARCLAKDPADRFQTAHQLLEALPDPSTLPGGWSSGAHGAMTTTAPPPLAPASAAWHRRAKWAAAGALLAAAGVLVYQTLGAAGEDDGATAVLAAPAPDGPVADPPPGFNPTEPGEDGAAETGAGNQAADDAEVATVSLEVVPDPEEAEVVIDGRLAGRGRQRLTLPRGEAPVTVLVRASGFEARERAVVPDQSRSIDVALKRSPRRLGPVGAAGTGSDAGASDPPDGPGPGLRAPTDLLPTPYDVH